MTGTALIVIDLQNDVVGACARREEVVGHAVQLIEKARAAGTPVLFVQHQDDWMAPGSTGWEFDDAIRPAPGEPVVAKKFWDSFADTTLAAELAAVGATRLVLTGAQTDFCIHHTIQSAVHHGFDVTLVADAHTTEDSVIDDVTVTADQIVAHTNAVVGSYRSPGRTINTQLTADVTFA